MIRSTKNWCSNWAWPGESRSACRPQFGLVFLILIASAFSRCQVGPDASLPYDTPEGQHTIRSSVPSPASVDGTTLDSAYLVGVVDDADGDAVNDILEVETRCGLANLPLVPHCFATIRSGVDLRVLGRTPLPDAAFAIDSTFIFNGSIAQVSPDLLVLADVQQLVNLGTGATRDLGLGSVKGLSGYLGQSSERMAIKVRQGNVWASGFLVARAGRFELDAVTQRRQAATQIGDVDGDGVVDFIQMSNVPAEKLICVSGRTGCDIWAASVSSEARWGGENMVSAPRFQDTNSDGIQDVFLLEGLAGVRVHSGADGKLVRFAANGVDFEWQDYGRVSIPVLVDDVDGDGVQDVLVVAERMQASSAAFLLDGPDIACFSGSTLLPIHRARLPRGATPGLRSIVKSRDASAGTSSVLVRTTGNALDQSWVRRPCGVGGAWLFEVCVSRDGISIREVDSD